MVIILPSHYSTAFVCMLHNHLCSIYSYVLHYHHHSTYSCCQLRQHVTSITVYRNAAIAADVHVDLPVVVVVGCRRRGVVVGIFTPLSSFLPRHRVVVVVGCIGGQGGRHAACASANSQLQVPTEKTKKQRRRSAQGPGSVRLPSRVVLTNSM